LIVIQPSAFPPRNRHQGHVLVVLHLRAGVPDRRKAPQNPLVS
jgi:hypothetical protein